MTVFSNTILAIANLSILKTSAFPKKVYMPWFSEECKKAINQRKRCLRLFSTQPSQGNLINLRHAQEIARKTIGSAKRTCWRNYTSKLNSSNSIRKAWNIINKISGKYQSGAAKHLIVQNQVITDNMSIASVLGETFAHNSSDDIDSKEFIQIKNQAEKHKINFSSPNTESYNAMISITKLEETINNCQDGASGPDGIHPQMIKHFPTTTIKLLLKILNCIWTTDYFPDQWHQSIIIPILKPNKDTLTR